MVIIAGARVLSGAPLTISTGALWIIACVLAVAALLGLFVLENGKLSSANNDLAAAKAKNNSLQATVNSLQRFKVLDDQRIAQKQTVSTAKTGR